MVPLQRKQFENCFESGCDVDEKSWIDPSVIISLQRAPSLIFSAQQHFCEDHGLDKKDDLGHDGDGDGSDCDDDDVAGDRSDVTLMTKEKILLGGNVFAVKYYSRIIKISICTSPMSIW